MTPRRAVRVHIQGVVQGVGFRPFVYGLARRYSLAGWVRNTSGGVQIEAEGASRDVQEFVQALEREAPPLAHIDRLEAEEFEAPGFTAFEILSSEPRPGEYQPISPDVSLCEDCRRELHDPADRRYRYPFINCTNCGPRFTIITDIPYDRPNTTMAAFPLCPDCAAEYQDPLDRRFHAQPVACPVCGPHIWLEVPGESTAQGEQALQAARQMLARGAILAVKGLGGFHLACDAGNEAAVGRLRERKLRVDKPFALMMYDTAAVERDCEVGLAEIELLTSIERPIVILERRQDSTIAPAAAPGQRTLGVMLPYTPLHELLLEPAAGFPPALVMTSGNLSEEPIATDNDEARLRLAGLADGFLLHNRPIRTRCDDSVVRAFDGSPYLLRRARGYAPYPVHLAWDGPSVLAAGAELKNTFCLTRGQHAFISHHIGDLENLETLGAFEDGVEHYQRLFRMQPEWVAYDLHPDYLATRFALRYAEQAGLPASAVQHHHAHIASCMAEHGLEPGERVIGLSFDGTGFGEDGAIWGGEVLYCGYPSFERLSHLAYVPLPGGDQAVRQPWRTALAWLWQVGLAWEDDLPPVGAASEAERGVIERMLESGLNSPPTSSLGRLFDAVAALCGVRMQVNYEAQAAIELESRLDPDERGAYPFEVTAGEFSAAPAIEALVADLRAACPVGQLSARFHNGLAQLALELAQQARRSTGCAAVALSGGVWQNMALLRSTLRLLRKDGFEVLVHRRVPANDGGLSLGQAAVAAVRALLGEPGSVHVPQKEV